MSPSTRGTTAGIRLDECDFEGVVEVTLSWASNVLNKGHDNGEGKLKETTPRSRSNGQLFGEVNHLAVSHDVGDLKTKVSELVDWGKEVVVAVVDE